MEQQTHFYNIFHDVLLDLCREHNVFGSVFDPDQRISAIKEGERNCVLRILTLVGYKDEDLVRMSQEKPVTNMYNDGE